MKKYYAASFAALMLVGCQKIDTTQDEVEPMVQDEPTCLEESKVCSEGSIAVRVGEDCQFEKCPELPQKDVEPMSQQMRNEGVNQEETLKYPVDEFDARITKKPFGIFITPSNSPVQSERFSGYHTGVDVEYDDVSEDVSVNAIADGTVVFSGWVNGYGGVTVLQHMIDGQSVQAVYGHLDPDSLLTEGTTVKEGESIGVLGEGGTSETDSERKHLHFALYSGNDLNLRGYVQSEGELEKWIDPVEAFTY
ncbi:M23 family metallopeptidase [Patescibacteria group bacterium]|nr:M23 family metallopeptidase [Patescibacteria group bacterium]